jgi:hypothetical protein
MNTKEQTMIEQQIPQIHVQAFQAAQQAAQAFANKHMNGRDGGACGFAWVDVYKVRSNSKLGKALQAQGFRKSYTGSLQLWNSWWYGQSIDAAEHGAVAYATILKQHGIEAYAGSRLD